MSHEADDPIVSVFRIHPNTVNEVWQWKLHCKGGIEIECDAADFSYDAGEARQKAWDFIDQHREKIRLAVLRKLQSL